MNEPPAANPSDPVRVLVVDDNRDAAESLCHLLDVLAYETAVAFDGPSAVVAFGRFDPHIAFIDLDMPGMDGCEVVRQFRQAEAMPPRRLFCLTGRKESQAELRCLNAGFDRFITKPMNAKTLIHALESPQSA